MHKLEIVQPQGEKHPKLFLDGIELNGVCSYNLSESVDDAQKLTVQFFVKLETK